MLRRHADPAPSIDLTIVIAAPPSHVLNAFFQADAIGAWWHAARSVTTPRVLGPYVVEWAPTTFTDDVLGRLGGVFRGTVMQFQAGEGFFVADVFWIAPDGDPIGPMAFAVACAAVDGNEPISTSLRVTQTGFSEGARWRRYYEVVGPGLERALAVLKALLEK